MIDKKTREQALRALERFLSRELDSDEYECEYPLPTVFGRSPPKDRAIKAIYGMTWNWFDDLTPHKLEGPYALQREIQEIAARCVLFLASDVEYEWKEDDFIQTGFTRSVLTSLGLIRTTPTIEVRIANHLDQPEGDASVWPFFRREDLLRCKPQMLSNPLDAEARP